MQPQQPLSVVGEAELRNYERLRALAPAASACAVTSIPAVDKVWDITYRGKIDFLELFAGSQRASAANLQAGLRVGQPIDLRTGFDLDSTDGQTRTMRIIELQMPEIIWMAIPCTPWTSVQNANTWTKVKQQRKEAIAMVRFCIRVAWYQLQHGRHFVIENPLTSQLWSLKDMQELINGCGVHMHRTDLCMHGLNDPESDGHRFRKSLRLLTTFTEEQLKPLLLQCDDKHEHTKVSSRMKDGTPRSVFTQVYPYRFCRLAAKLFALHLSSKNKIHAYGTSTEEDAHYMDKGHADLIWDLMEEAEFTQEEEEALLALSQSVTDGLSEGIECASALVADTNVVDNPISDCRKLMTMINMLPAKTELSLDYAGSSRQWTMCDLIRSVRHHYLPSRTFHGCTVLRGVDSKTSLRTRGQGVVFMWKKGKTTVHFVDVASFDWSNFDFSSWSIVLLRDEDDAGSITGGAASSQFPAVPIPSTETFSTPPSSPGPDDRPDRPRFLPRPLDDDASPPSGGDDGHPPDPPPFPFGQQAPHTVAPLFPPGMPPIPQSQHGLFGPRSGVHWENTAELQALPRTRMHPGPPPGGYHPPDQPIWGTRNPTAKMKSNDRFAIQDNQAPLLPGIGGTEPLPLDRSRDIPKQPAPLALHDVQRTKGSPIIKADLFGNAKTAIQSHRGEKNRSPNKALIDKGSFDYANDEHRSRATGSSDPMPPQQFDLARDDTDDDATPPRDDDAQTEAYFPTTDLPLRDDTDDDEFQDFQQYSDDSDVLFVEGDDAMSYLNDAQRAYSMVTESFDRPCDRDGHYYNDDDVYTPPNLMHDFSFFGRFASDKSDLYPDMTGITDDDKAIKLLYQSKAYSSFYSMKRTTLLNRKRKEASVTELRQYNKQFAEAKLNEVQSWIDQEVYELIDMRKIKCKNFVTGRWVLTVKVDKDGKFLKTKARWVLRGFQDKQRYEQQTDSPTATRPGFRLTCQLAANHGWDLTHIDLKTAFLQGQVFDGDRDVVCQLPPEAGYDSWIGARLVRPAYGLNDAPRRWWNVLDGKLHEFGLVPTRADRCTYVLYSNKKPTTTPTKQAAHSAVVKPPKLELTDALRNSSSVNLEAIQAAIDLLHDPITGSPAANKTVVGCVCLHVDDLFMTGNAEFHSRVVAPLRQSFAIGSEDKNSIEFVGQRIRWIDKGTKTQHICVDQSKAIEALAEMDIEKGLRDELPCSPQQHTLYRSVLGQINWLQSRTQFQACYSFSRCASASAAPKIGDCRALNKLVRQIRSNPVSLRFYPLQGTLRIVGYPDASYRNNGDGSSQRGLCIFLAEARTTGRASARGCLVDYESHKINRTTLSTTVAELYAFQKVYGSCCFMRGLWKDISGQSSDIHMRTDANNLVTTAQTTRLPEQKETMHMIQQLRKQSVSGEIQDLAHIRTEHMLADCLTKSSIKPDNLVQAVKTGVLPDVDSQPEFRTLLKHKAYAAAWCAQELVDAPDVHTLLGVDVRSAIQSLYADQSSFVSKHLSKPYHTFLTICTDTASPDVMTEHFNALD